MAQKQPDAAATPASRVLRSLSAASVLAAVALGLSANILVARFYERWDVTSRGLYTLSDATVETLETLDEPVDIIVLLSASDPLTVSVRHLLSAYGSKTRKLSPRYVDPDRSPAEFMAIQQKYGIEAGKSEDGRVVTDASIIIARGERHWFVTQDDVVAYDEDDGRARPKLEQALTEGIRNVFVSDRPTFCFTTGHQEMSIDDGGPTGLAELRYRLQKNNYDIESVDLAAPKLTRALDECAVVVVGGPEVPFAESASKRLEDYVRAGGSVLFALNPILDGDNRISPTGLESVARLGGIELSTDFVVERDERLRLPAGLGESFFATPREHAITRGLLKGNEARFRLLVSAAQSLALSGDRPSPLVTSSPQAFSIKDIRPFVAEGKPVEKSAGDPEGPFILAAAAELPKPAQSTRAHGPRLVVIGTANPVWGRNFREPTLIGNRLFVESAVSWLAARPAIVSVPEKASHDVGLNLTEESLRDVMLYVLLYMPGSAALLGGLVMLRRRAREKRSRAEHEAKRESEEKGASDAVSDDDDPETDDDDETHGELDDEDEARS